MILAMPVRSAYGHSVAQVQTTKFFAPETLQLLLSRAAGGTPGFQVGDTVSYIVQFTPVENDAAGGPGTVGANGYVTDYIPSGTQVTGAWIVAKDGSGNYYPIPPSLPGGIDTGWSEREGLTGMQVFTAPFNVATYDPTGRCTAGGYTNNCRGRLTEHYADTGIFFSTDPRTAQFPAPPTRIAQGTNGYNVLSTVNNNLNGAGQLNPIIGQTQATTHNLWDADQTNAFGSATQDITPLAAPVSPQGSLVNAQDYLNYGILGTIPYYAGSAVAGPQTGYPLDNTGQIGPWQRIAYIGSRTSDPTSGPATNAGACQTCVGGLPTSVGWNLSSTNPLPAGTNAVRWALGRLTVGEFRYVKISLKLTAPIPSGGLINGSEVFGGDSSEADNGDDNVWRYHVPSVADNNSNLYVLKTVVGYYSGATLIPVDGSMVPANAKLRYRIVYMNSGNANQDNVILADTLPCQTAANSVSNITVLNGPISAMTVPALTAIPAGNCATNPDTRQAFRFNNNVGVTLLPAAGGSIEFDVQTNAAVNDIMANTATLTSTQIPAPGVTSNANSNVGAYANLSIVKTTSTPTLVSGGTATYTITVTNVGAANATAINVYDMLPTTGGANNADTRFSFNPGSSIFSGITPTVPTTSVPPTLAPYTTGGLSTNQQQVRWNFNAGQTLTPGASFTITFSAVVGTNVPASVTPYQNTIAVVYNGGTVPRLDVSNIADVTVLSPLSVTKTVESYCTAACGAPANWIPVSGSGQVPVNARIRYNIVYANTSAVAINNVVLTETLPCQTGAAPVSYMNTANTVSIVSGPIPAPAAATLSAILAGACPGTRRSFSFPAANFAASGQPDSSGQIKFDVQTNAAAGSVVVNTASITGTGAPANSSEAQASVLSAPLLQIAKTTTTPNLATGGTATFQITVTNTGTANAAAIALYDWLPTSAATPSAATRFSYAATSLITGMTPTAATTVIGPTRTPYSADAYATNMQEVVWNFGAQTLAPGASFTVTFTATAGASVPPAAAYYNNARVYYGTEQANAGPVSVSVGNNLSTSTKAWVDLNGGDALPGDVIEYTITLKETSGIAAAGITVSDILSSPTYTTPAVSLCPPGATCGFAGLTFTASNVSVSAGGTEQVVIRATIAAGTATGTVINNCATVTTPGGTGAAPCASSITVNASGVAGSGNKPLYLYDAASAYKLSRTKPGAAATVSIPATGGTQTWTLSPALASPVRISDTLSSAVPVRLYLNAAAGNYGITASLLCSGTLVTQVTSTLALTAAPTGYLMYLPLAGTATCPAASAWQLRVRNGGANAVTVSPLSGVNTSDVTLPSLDVVSAATITVYNAVYPGGTAPASFPTGTTVHIRTTVNDPFGSYDITGAAVTIRDPNNAILVSSATMTQVADSGALSKTFEYSYYVNAGSPAGNWTITVVAREGTEGTVADLLSTSLTVVVAVPNIVVVKSAATFADPFNGTANPKNIPGAIVEYTMLVTNFGTGATDSGSVYVTNAVPVNTELFVNDIGAGYGPVAFADNAPSSGLTLPYTSLNDAFDGIEFSKDNGSSYGAAVSADANGCDSQVTHIRFRLNGAFAATGGPPHPSFTLRFRVRVK